MARTWLSIEVQLVSGRGEYYWPRPGRLFVAKRTFTFRQLANAINVAFARWELSHLHRFVLEDGTEIIPGDWWDDAPEDAVDDSTKLSVLDLGARFAFEFDMGDSWEHVCTVGHERVDPYEIYGAEPEDPSVYFGWGEIPDQHGRRWSDDDGSESPQPEPDPPTSDLPPIMPHWGDWNPPSAGGRLAWLSSLKDWDDGSWRQLRGAVYSGDGHAVVELLRRRDPVEVAQLAGDGLLIALDQRIEDAYVLARRLADEIRDRFLPGDAILAEELDAARAAALSSALEPVRVDLEELAMHLEGDSLGPEGWRLDVQTGEWWPEDPVGMAGEEPPDHWEEPDRWLEVMSLGSPANLGQARFRVTRPSHRGGHASTA